MPNKPPFCISGSKYYVNSTGDPCIAGYSPGGLADLAGKQEGIGLPVPIPDTNSTPSQPAPLTPPPVVPVPGITPFLGQLGKLTDWLSTVDHWKGLGLVALAAVLGVAGVLLFISSTKSGQTVIMRSAEVAA